MNMTHPDILQAERYGLPEGQEEVDEQWQREQEELRDELRKDRCYE